MSFFSTLATHLAFAWAIGTARADTPAWTRIVSVDAPDHHRYFAFFREETKLVIRDCGSVRLEEKPAAYDNIADLNSVCSPSANQDVRIQLDLLKQELKRIFLMPGPPFMTQALLPEFAKNTRSRHGRPDHEHDLHEAVRLLRVKGYIEGIGTSEPDRERPPNVGDGNVHGATETLRDILSSPMMYGLIRQFDPSKGECGGIMSDMAKTRKSCAGVAESSYTSSSGVLWSMVARKWASNGRFYEVWRDTQTGLLWGERLDSWIQHTNTVISDASGKPTQETACRSAEGRRATAELDSDFALPTVDDYAQAYKDGIGDALPAYGYYYWSSVDPDNPDLAHVAASAAATYVDFRDTYGSVRCVGRKREAFKETVGR